MKATAGEVYTVYNQYLKRYTACQVAYIALPDTVSKESWAVVLSLDWVGDAPLTAEELPHLRGHHARAMTLGAFHLNAGGEGVVCTVCKVGFINNSAHTPTRSFQEIAFTAEIGMVSNPLL